MTDEIRVTIAAQACILLLNREHDYYAGLHSILVYPSSYLAPSKFVDPAGVVQEGEESRPGEAWPRVRSSFPGAKAGQSLLSTLGN